MEHALIPAEVTQNFSLGVIKTSSPPCLCMPAGCTWSAICFISGYLAITLKTAWGIWATCFFTWVLEFLPVFYTSSLMSTPLYQRWVHLVRLRAFWVPISSFTRVPEFTPLSRLILYALASFAGRTGFRIVVCNAIFQWAGLHGIHRARRCGILGAHWRICVWSADCLVPERTRKGTCPRATALELNVLLISSEQRLRISWACDLL